MSQMKIIRKEVLQLSQAEVASIADASQATVSRWENGSLFPDLRQLTAIAAAARKKGIAWKHEWFFNPASIPKRKGAQ